MSAKYKSPSFLLPNELNTSANPANDTGINSLYSMDFNGSSDYINLGDSDSLSFGNSYTDSPFSISAWIYMNDATSFRILNKYNAPNYEYQFDLSSSDKLQFYIFDGSNYRGVGYDSALSINQWYHVAATYDGRGESSAQNGMVLYVNGSPVNDITYSSGSYTAMHNTAAPVNIGKIASSYANGKIDEVAIFNRALNTTEIAALYGGTSPNIYPSNLMATDLNPIAYYPLGEQAQMQGYLGNEASSEWQFPNGVLQDYVMDFDGSDDFVDCGQNISLDTGDLSASIWINKDSAGSGTQYVFNNNNGSSIAGFVFAVNNSNQVFISRRTRTYQANTGWKNISFTEDAWHNLSFTYNDTTKAFEVWFNGNSVHTSTATSSTSGASQNIIIGTNSGLTGLDFDGKISNAVIWNSDQSANISNIYNNGSPQTSYTVTPQNWWKLNADSVYTPSAPNYTKALKLNVSSSDNINFTQGLLNNLSEFSISFWYNRAAANNWPSYSVILTQLGLLDIGQFRYENNNAGIYVSLTTANGTFTIPSTGSGRVYLNEWLFVTVVYDGVNLISYRNGELAPGTNTVAATGNTVTNTNNFKLEPTHGLDYSVSNLAFHNTALTSSQVSTLFNFGTPETNISFSPQAWWKLDDQNAITDSSGNGNTGTNNGATDISSGVAVTPSWKIPSALTVPEHNYLNVLNFNSSQSDYINTASNVGVSGSQSRTMSVWLKGGNANNGKNWPMAVSFGTNSANKAMWIGGGGSGAAYWYFGWWSTDLATNIRMDADNDWHLLTSTYDGTTAKGYIDGVEVISGARTINTTDSPLIIGKHIQDSTYWDGPISNVSIWNTALTGSQVSTIYNNGKPETAISFSPIGWWKLDSATITDSAGSNNGTNNGAEVELSNVIAGSIPVNGVSTTLPSTALQQSDLQFDSPYSNYSLSFDGTGDKINCGAANAYNIVTLSAWVKPDNPNTYGAIFGTRNGGGVDFPYQLTNFSGKFRFISAGATAILSDNGFNSGVWYHVIGVADGTNLKMYVNGQLQNATASYSAPIPTPNNDLMIGAQWNTDSSYLWTGKIDETAIWNTALTEAQVLEIYNNGKPGNLDNFSGTAPISWWRLGENAYFDNNSFVVPNSIAGAPNGVGSGTITTMISADAPGTYANGVGTNLDILDRVGDAPLSTSNSQSYNMIPSDISPYVPAYVGKQIANNYSMAFDPASNTYFNAGNLSAINGLQKVTYSFWMNDSSGGASYPIGTDGQLILMPLINSNRFDVYLNGTSSSARIYNNQTLTILNTNQWHHIVLVIDSTLSTANQRTKIYIDGNSYTDSSGTPITQNATIGTVTTDTNIGRASGSTPAYFSGKLDEVAIFDTALNAGQIYNDIYQPTATGTNQTADFVNNPNLPNPVAWYRMGD